LSTDALQNEQQFISGLYARLDDLRARAESSVRQSVAQVGTGRQAKLERDVQAQEETARLAQLNAVETGLCFGRVDFRNGETHHIGRIGMREDDDERTPLLIDWRAPVARPFYLATGYSPMGLRRRRHLTTQGRTVTDLHDEIMDLGDATRTGYENRDADEVLLAALNTARTGRMTDIVQTIQAEQDRIIRAPHHGVLVVEGGPGTGKTAVALHRAAYLLYAHREQLARRAVLIVGPNPAFLGYIGEVLPSLGETGVLLATTGELVPGVVATGTDTPATAAVKGRAAMADVLARVVRDRQTVPERAAEIDHEDHGVLLLERAAAEDARAAARATGLPHNLARPHFAFRVIDALTAQLAERIGADPYGGPNLLGPDDLAQLGKEVATSRAVHAAIDELWPNLTAQRLISDFLADPLQLPEDEQALIRRSEGPWTPADVPLLDEAAELLGADDSAERAAAEAARQEQIAYAQGVLDVSAGSKTYEFEDEESEILAAHDIIDAERFADRQEETDTRSAAERAAADRTWAFGHIVVDEAQELSAMAWRLLMRRCPSRSMTLVGDPAQTGDAAGCDSWEQILGPHVGDRWTLERLGVNYRTPAEIMEVAADVRRSAEPDFVPPRSVRSTGLAPLVRTVPEEELVTAAAELAAKQHSDQEGGGRLAVIAPATLLPRLAAELPDASCGETPDLTRPTVLLSPRQAKGLEFDRVVVVDPETLLARPSRGVNDLYVALTRPTQWLGIVRSARTPSRVGPDGPHAG
jgi:DNA helicase IV